jgi:Domain of unknown function (DUF4383)
MQNRSPVQVAALIVGIAFLAVGILGFIPGITTNYDELKFVGEDSEAMLLGIFKVNILHNLVHLAFGLIGLTLAATATGARSFLIVGGIVYLVLWIFGLVIDLDEPINFVSLNTADNWLHFALGAGMLVLGLVLGRDVARDGFVVGERRT